ncbi:MAG: MFS transporter [Rickettsia endosymbiont of Platyusa sonomae]|nr:MFS transporter [Rickettsia endosymbiont of Platyusa sonomae]
MDRKSMTAALIGHAMERYDVVLYGFFAAILAPNFFPADENIALIASSSSFASGYFMRPIGAIFFGTLGDKIGRKQAFLYSILFVIFPTLTISILPTYDKIGIISPIILILCRLMQGFCAGGEFSGAAIYIGEHTSKKYAGFAGSFVCATGFLGVAIGTSIGSFSTASFMPDWGWRIPFFIGGITTMASYFLRRNMDETPDFKKVAKQKQIVRSPLKIVLKDWKNNLLCTIGIGACGHIFLYITTLHLSTIYKEKLQISASNILGINTFLILYWMVLVMVMGYISDKLGIKNLMRYSSLSILFLAYPIFVFLHQNLTFTSCIVSQLILITIGAGFFVPVTGIFTELFPTQERYSDIAFGITIGQALLGGTTPLIATSLVSLTGSPQSPSLYMSFGALIGYLGITKMRKID